MLNIKPKTNSGNIDMSNCIIGDQIKTTKTEKLAHKLGTFVGKVVVVCMAIIVIMAVLVLTTILIRAMMSLL